MKLEHAGIVSPFTLLRYDLPRHRVTLPICDLLLQAGSGGSTAGIRISLSGLVGCPAGDIKMRELGMLRHGSN